MISTQVLPLVDSENQNRGRTRFIATYWNQMLFVHNLSDQEIVVELETKGMEGRQLSKIFPDDENIMPITESLILKLQEFEYQWWKIF